MLRGNDIVIFSKLDLAKVEAVDSVRETVETSSSKDIIESRLWRLSNLCHR